MSENQRYTGRLERYYISPYPTEVHLTTHEKTRLVTVEDAAGLPAVEGISAMALSIDGTPIAFNGDFWTNVTHIEHMPREHKAGLINLVTDGVDNV